MSRIEGGSTVNSIAQEVTTLLYEYRSASEACLQVMKGKLNRVVNEFRTKGKKINLEVLGVRPGYGDGDKTELKKWTSENAVCIRQYYEGELDLGPYSTDANIPLSRNVLANTIGTVKGAGAHTRAEWVDLKSLPAVLGIVLSPMNRYLD